MADDSDFQHLHTEGKAAGAPPLESGADDTTPAKEEGDKAGNTSAKTGKDVKVLTWPRDLDSNRQVIRFNIKDRSSLAENAQTIYMPIAPGFAVSDGASYGNKPFNMLGQLANEAYQNLEGGSIPEIVQSFKAQIGQWKGGELIDVGQKAFADRWGSGLDAVAAWNIRAGIAANANQNLEFEGVMMRNFTFQWKLVAESADDSERIRKIENTFRKFLYPSSASQSLLFEYPPYWMIQFYHGENDNPYMPMLGLCYLRSMSATYNSTTNAFHRTGAPVELDLSLTFDEAQQVTRQRLYSKEGVDYHWQRGGIQQKNFGDDIDTDSLYNSMKETVTSLTSGTSPSNIINNALEGNNSDDEPPAQ